MKSINLLIKFEQNLGYLIPTPKSIKPTGNKSLDLANTMGLLAYDLGGDALAIFDTRNYSLFTSYISLITASNKPQRTAMIYKIKKMANSLFNREQNFYLSKSGWEIIDFGDVKIDIDDSERVIIYDVDFYKNISKVLESTTERTKANYLVWRLVASTMKFLSKDARDIRRKYTKVLNGISVEQPAWKRCLKTVGWNSLSKSNFVYAVTSMYARKVFKRESKAQVVEMTDYLRRAFKQILDELEWMDDETKSKASIKADQVADFIGYPSYIVNDKPKMDKDYEDLSVNNDIFMNVVNAQNRAYDLDIKILPEDTDRERWSTGPAIVNAWYSPTRNTITFPAGILQAPFYDAGAPTATNYGAIGTVIGHELTHGFDDSGANYDGEGNKKNWWSDSSRENFNKNTQCMADQYSSYYWDEADLYVDGRSTLGENIADNGGIRESFFAYKEWRKDNKELRAPGLSSFSDEQLFFLGFSQVWCALYTPEEAANRVKTDVHSPNRFRVQGPLSNFEEFGKAFNCKQGQDLYYPNKEDTCQVW